VRWQKNKYLKFKITGNVLQLGAVCVGLCGGKIAYN